MLQVFFYRLEIIIKVFLEFVAFFCLIKLNADKYLLQNNIIQF